MNKIDSVRVVSTEGVGFGTKIFDTKTGAEVQGVCDATIRIVPDDVVKVSLTIGAALVDVAGTPTFYAADPVTGDLLPVKAIEFADGTRREF